MAIYWLYSFFLSQMAYSFINIHDENGNTCITHDFHLK